MAMKWVSSSSAANEAFRLAASRGDVQRIRKSCDCGHINLDYGAYPPRHRGLEVAMRKMTLRVPTSFGEALKQVFVGSARVASPDLQNCK